MEWIHLIIKEEEIKEGKEEKKDKFGWPNVKKKKDDQM